MAVVGVLFLVLGAPPLVRALFLVCRAPLMRPWPLFPFCSASFVMAFFSVHKASFATPLLHRAFTMWFFLLQRASIVFLFLLHGATFVSTFFTVLPAPTASVFFLLYRAPFASRGWWDLQWKLKNQNEKRIPGNSILCPKRSVIWKKQYTPRGQPSWLWAWDIVLGRTDVSGSILLVNLKIPPSHSSWSWGTWLTPSLGLGRAGLMVRVGAGI